MAENAMQQSTPGYPIIDSSKRLTRMSSSSTGSGRLSSSDKDLLIKLVGDKKHARILGSPPADERKGKMMLKGDFSMYVQCALLQMFVGVGWRSVQSKNWCSARLRFWRELNYLK